MAGPALHAAARAIRRVFGGRDASGNRTGIVLLAQPAGDDAMQAAARRIGCPDTIFLVEDDGGWTGASYSPHIPLAFCVQTLLGAASALRGWRRAGASQAVPIRVGGAAFAVRPGPAAAGGTSAAAAEWLTLPRSHFRIAAAPAAARRLPFPLAGPPRIVAAGRRRLFLPLADEAELHRLALSDAEASALLGRLAVDGLCFHAPPSGSAVALRVFTTSLAGGEDVATGGAAASLALLIEARDGTVRVLQGSGPKRRRGEILVRRAADGGVDVGGEVHAR